MTDDTPLPFDLPSVRRKKRTVDFAGANQSSNAGVLTSVAHSPAKIMREQMNATPL
jgi:hypothetical protein